MYHLIFRVFIVCFSILLLTLIKPLPTFAEITYTYDANGNMTSDGSHCYTYNDGNQLSQVKDCGSGQIVAQYVYDYQGSRLAKKEYTNGNLQETIYYPNKSYETKKLANGTTQNTTYYYANDQILARKNPNGTKTFYHNDHLGSTNVLTDQSGNLVEKTTYYPFGEVRTGGIQSKYLYTGKELDSETTLNYYGARYYDSHIHRFVQPDQEVANIYDPQELNAYSYARNNPLRYTDPSGNSIFDSIKNIFQNVVNTVKSAVSAVISKVSSVFSQGHSDTGTKNIQTQTQPTSQNNNQTTININNNTVKILNNNINPVVNNAVNPSGNATVQTGSIYWALNQQTGLPTYIGQTTNFPRRQTEHLRIAGREVEQIKGLESLPKKDLDGIEQAFINRYGLDNLDNKINVINSRNPIYEDSVNVGNSYLEDLLDLPEPLLIE